MAQAVVPRGEGRASARRRDAGRPRREDPFERGFEGGFQRRFRRRFEGFGWSGEQALVLGVPAAALLGVTVLWVLRGGAADLLTSAGRASSLGRLTGLLCAVLFAMSVVMMARLPVLERAFGQDKLVRHHRVVGVGATVLLLLHVVLITWGYSIGSGLGLIAEFADLVLHYPDMVVATAGTALLLLVVITSIPVLRRRLRYEAWHLTHLYAYLGVALAVPHETGLGTELEEPTLVTVAWWVAWIVALASVLVWRVGRPVMLSLRHELEVESIVQENTDSVSVYIRGRDLLDLRAEPGQFFVWRFLSGRGWSRGHPYSLSAPPTDQQLRITVRDLGDGSGALGRLTPGTRVFVEGPYGRMHPGVHRGGPAVLIASGIGITPIRAMLEELETRPGELTVLYRAAGPYHLVLADELDRIARARAVKVHYLLGPRRKTRRRASWAPSSAGTLSDAQMLQLLVPGLADHDVYICGPHEWAGSVRQAALDAGVPAARIHGEFVKW